MVSSSQSFAVHAPNRIPGRNGLIDRYFYFAMSLLAAAIVVWGFSHSIDSNLFHPAIPRPFLLWIHGAAFTAWVVFYISQSVLVRTHNVKVHRTLGWVGVGLAAAMVVLGFTIAVIMGSFDKHMLHVPDSDTFLSVPFGDMIVFGTLVTLAIIWRKKPELHRRLLFMATFALMDAPFGRIDYIFNNSLFFVCVDSLILLGVARDLLVNRRIHQVYLVALPILIVFHAFLVYLWRGAPGWWLHLGQSILG
jgi:FtsH-binding integral membrane protein